MKTTSIKKNVLIYTIYQILCIIVPFITVPYVSRILGPQGIGIYSYTHSLVIYFTMFAALGTMSYGSREIARLRDNKEKLSKLFWEIEFLTIITSSICILIWLVFAVIYHTYTSYMIILTILIVNVIFDISWLYIGLEKFKYTVSVNSFFKILGIVLIFLFIKEDGDVYKYILITSMVTLAGTISMWMFLPKHVEKPTIKNINLKKHFKETLIYFIPTIATSIYTILDKTLIGLITNDLAENGYYEQATKIIDVCKTTAFVSLNAVLGSRIAYLYSQSKYDEIKNRIKNSIDFIFFMSIGMIYGLVGVSDVFVPLFFGEEFANAALYIKLLSPVILIIGISNCLGSHYFTPAGLRKKSAKYIIIGAITNLVINMLLIPNFKSVGAIIATIIAELTISFLYLKNCNGFLSLKDLLKLSYKKVIAGFIMYLFIFYITKLSMNVYLMLVVQIVLGALLYVICLLIMRDKFIFETVLNFLKSKMHIQPKKEV